MHRICTVQLPRVNVGAISLKRNQNVTISPLAAAEHGVFDVDACLTTLLCNTDIFLLSQELVQVRQGESFLLVVLLDKSQMMDEYRLFSPLLNSLSLHKEI